MESLEGKRVVVLGATSGIGLAAVQQAVALGAQVDGASRSGEKVATAKQSVPGARFHAIDIHDTAQLTQLFEQVGTVDHIVGCATGADRTIAPFLEQTQEQLATAFGKFWGYCNLVRCGAPFIREDGSITLVSGTPARKCNPGMSAISCVGSAVEGLVRALALEMAPVRVNVVAPGLIDTGMFDWMGDRKGSALEEMSRNVPLGRPGRSEEVASAITHAMMNTYMTGATLDVDGGTLLP